jgi:hypothetical protein
MILGDPSPITIGGVSGLVGDFTTTGTSVPVVGQVIVVMVTPTQQFLILGGGPQADWQGEFRNIFNAVVASITFFTPEVVVVPEVPIPPVSMQEVSQWAEYAYASSEYNYPNWGAIQAIGMPDTFECADQSTAWASATSSGVDWIELTYGTLVIPTRIDIYETYNPDYVTRVEVLDVNGTYFDVYNAVGSTVTDCPYILSIPVTGVSSYVYGVRITVDQTNAPWWNEIDAVQLVGQADSAVIAPAAP